MRALSIIMIICCIGTTIKSDIDFHELHEVQLYSYFTEQGARKFELNPKFVEFQKDSTNKITIDTEEVQLIKQIISTADKYKLRGDKIGVNLLYFDFIFSSDTNPRHFILVNTSAFIDLYNNCIYSVNDEKHRLWLKEFQNKYRCQKIY